jgi:site-specific recombinase XerD
LVERLNGIEEVTSSNLVGSTTCEGKNAARGRMLEKAKPSASCFDFKGANGRQTPMDKQRQTAKDEPTGTKERTLAWQPPRGIRFLKFPNRPAQPYGVQWRVDGQRKTKTFATREAQETFAKKMAGDVKRDGLAAYRLNPDEAREWRQFRADIGDADLADVVRVWRRYGGSTTTGITLADAVAAFLKAKEGEGVSDASLRHFKPVLRQFKDAVGNVTAASIERTQLEAYLTDLDTQSAETRRTHFKRVRTLFNWLKETRQIVENPCDGWKAPREALREISVMSVEDGVKLFAENHAAPKARELLGRLALEAFCGMRHETAAQIGAAGFDFVSKVITIPATIDKNRKAQFIEHAEDNLWQWLAWSKPETWTMDRIQYRNAKSSAFVRAKIAHVHNVLRHSAASYHIAKYGDAGKTAAMLTHANLRMLWSNYRGKGGGQANGKAWFAIVPPA